MRRSALIACATSADTAMNILLTNDDGPLVPGICLLRKALGSLGEVTVVCPATERSGVSHGITYMAPVRARSVLLADGGPAHVLTGTPADCVKFALLQLLDRAPELVVSGPNLGLNIGVDLFYSGTVAAALEGAFHGITSVAVSTHLRNAGNMGAVAAEALRVLHLLLDEARELGPRAFNVNIPTLGTESPAVRFTRQSPAAPRGEYARAQAPRQEPCYWLDWTPTSGVPPADSDVAALNAGCISVTPLRCDLTDREELARLREVASSQAFALQSIRTRRG